MDPASRSPSPPGVRCRIAMRELRAEFEGPRHQFERLVQRLSGPIPEDRQRVVLQAWQQLAPDPVQTVPVERLLASYRAEGHPDVREGRLTARDAESRLELALRAEAGAERGVGYQVFEAYHAAVSAAIEEDKEFSGLVGDSWGLEEPPAAPDWVDSPVKRGSSAELVAEMSRQMDKLRLDLRCQQASAAWACRHAVRAIRPWRESAHVQTRASARLAGAVRWMRSWRLNGVIGVMRAVTRRAIDGRQRMDEAVDGWLSAKRGKAWMDWRKAAEVHLHQQYRCVRAGARLANVRLGIAWMQLRADTRARSSIVTPRVPCSNLCSLLHPKNH